MPEMSIEGFRLSPQQKRLWLLQQSVPNQPYRSQCAVLIEGHLNLNILETALKSVVAKHEILRTNFKLLPGMSIPIQVIHNNSVEKILYYDLTDLKPEAQEAQIKTLIDKANRLSFDLENSSILQISLVILAPDKHILLICLPAISADRVTLQNLVREMSGAYDACLHNKESSDTPLQYADFAEWQNELFEGEEAETGKGYWRKKNIAEFIDLKFFLEKDIKSIEFEPKFITHLLNHQQLDKLKIISQQYNVSLSTVLLTSWQVLLWNLTRQSDIMIGIYCDGRNYKELESGLGLFAKYLPIHSHLEEELKFSQVLQHVNSSTADIFKWQESWTWEEMIGSTENRNKLSFFPVCFDFKTQPAKFFATDLSFHIYQQYDCLEKFKLKLSCYDCNDSLKLEFHYDENKFSQENIEVLAEQFQVLLESVTDTPDAVIDELKFLRERDLHQLLIEFNQTQTSDLSDNCIHHLFEEQAARTPDSIAVVFENQQLTYRELNQQANRLAHHLQRLGVGPETVVGLYVQRSLNMVIGLLGILKAGGAYLPLDPALPSQGVAFRLQAAKVPFVISHSSLLSSSGQMTVVCLDTNSNAIAQEPDTNPQIEITNKNLVYVLFTSGSTGKPKGVAVEHRQLLNYLNSILEKLPVSTGASFATVSTFAADLGNTVIFPSLCTGGCLHIVSLERAQDPEALADYCRLHPIDCLKIVPSHLATLLTSTDCKQILPRQCLILGGEATTWELIEQIRQYNPNCLILNHYGPTEATVGVTTFTVETKQAEMNTKTVPLGRSLANTHIYLLNRHLQPVPIGVPGELYIGGVSLARGYINQPELTSVRFIPNPFANSKFNRLYKTGDLARYLSDGNIEFLGRIDHQVKIRGFRIELGEIEAVLSQHPMVREAVVVTQEEELGQQRLVAYVVPNDEDLALTQLQTFLRQQLPEYMVPSAFLLLKNLPRTPNGKVDRQALLTADGVRLELAAAYVSPQTEVEQTIATLWRQMLHLEKVSIHDNFFDLGGHSLLLVQMCHKLRESFNTDISITDLFKYPTISSLAVFLNQEQNKHNPIFEPSRTLDHNDHKNLRKRQIQLRQQQRKALQREDQDE